MQVSHAKQLKQMQAELRKALAGGTAGSDAAMAVMHARQVEALQGEVRSLRAELDRAAAASPHPEATLTSARYTPARDTSARYTPARDTPCGSGRGSGGGASSLSRGGGAHHATAADEEAEGSGGRLEGGGGGGGGEGGWEGGGALGSLTSLRGALLSAALLFAEAHAALHTHDARGDDVLRLTPTTDSTSRASLMRLAAERATDEVDELRRLQQTAAALQALAERLTHAYTHGFGRPPRWLLRSWHLVSACGGGGGHRARRTALNLDGGLGGMWRSYDRVPLGHDGEGILSPG